MTRQQIKGIQYDPHPIDTEEYQTTAPEGTWNGYLDYHAWGKSQNLFCFFTDVETDECYRLSVFSRSGYKPYKNGPAFDQEPVGGLFKITTETSKNGLSKFLSAEKIED